MNTFICTYIICIHHIYTQTHTSRKHEKYNMGNQKDVDGITAFQAGLKYIIT